MSTVSRRSFLKGSAGVLAGAAAMDAFVGKAAAVPPATVDPKLQSNFGRMFDLPGFRPDPDPVVSTQRFAALAQTMLDPNVTQPAPGNHDNVEEGSWMTYFGQFVDHDLTLDLQPQPDRFFRFNSRGGLLAPDGSLVLNNESFLFDLSSVYGNGPDVSPELYTDDGHFLVQEPNLNGVRDLPRNPDGSAILVEHRNDENEILSQVHTAFLKAHNTIMDEGGLDHDAAHDLLVKHYQWIVLNEFLPKIAPNPSATGFYNPGDPNSPVTPVEWSTAAYRFGHSIVRKAYEVTTKTGKLQVFNGTAADLHGGRPLPAGREIDWGNFHPALIRPENVAHFNFPRFIDTQISSGLFTLPIGGLSGAENSGANILGFRNMVRGLFYNLPSLQDIGGALGLPVLSPTDAIDPDNVPGFEDGTPLWYGILKESELAGGHNLGATGASIVTDVFLGLLKADKDGLLHDNSPEHGRWTPTLPSATPGGFLFSDLLLFAGVASKP